jgi:hypothetical protein
MIRSQATRRTVITGAAAVVVAAAVPRSAAWAAAPSTASSVDLGTTGIPAMVDPARDLASHEPGPEPTWSDSIYFTSTVKAGGQEFGLLVHTVATPTAPDGGGILAFSLTNKTAGWYKSYQTSIAGKDYRWSRDRLEITMPGLTWTGDATRMAVQVATDWGSLDVTLEPEGPVMNYAGTGYFNLIDVPNYEFAFPRMRTAGTLVVDGHEHKITGTSWLDRQWGPLPQTLRRWAWMNLDLPTGDTIAIWDAVGTNTENAWATVLHPDGSYDLAAVEPLAHSASRPWTSPTTGNAYPTRWRVTIPALRAQLDVRVTGTPGQELILNVGSRLEATAAFTGTYQGRRVKGENYVELVGDWRP